MDLVPDEYGNERIHILDLIRQGKEGLLGALKIFGTSDQDDFTAYAARHIGRAIKEAVTDDGSAG
ncbi:MAG: hypothetical protein ACKV22_05875 [Bryobacteraceae bacterium]